jgi:hypothetical protein
VVETGPLLLAELVEVVPSPVVVVVVVLPAVVLVGATVVEVGGRVVVVVVGRAVEVVAAVVAGRAVAAGGRGRRGRVVVTPAKRLRWRLVVEGATARGGARPGEGSPEPAGAVSNPSRLPPPAPSIMATSSVAQRRSRLNRTDAPACASRSDGNRIGRLRPIFSGGYRSSASSLAARAAPSVSTGR